MAQFRAARLALLVALMPAGCAYSERTGDQVLAVQEVSIDPDVFVEASPGVGVGVFVEYQSGGLWEVFTTCDTELSGYACSYDVILSVPPGHSLRDVEGVELESSDGVYFLADGAVQLFATTRYRFDRILFETDAGEALRVDAALDGYADPAIVVWNGYGGIQDGAPTNPVDLAPAEP
jgi:hypothetical protein